MSRRHKNTRIDRTREGDVRMGVSYPTPPAADDYEVIDNEANIVEDVDGNTVVWKIPEQE